MKAKDAVVAMMTMLPNAVVTAKEIVTVAKCYGEGSLRYQYQVTAIIDGTIYTGNSYTCFEHAIDSLGVAVTGDLCL